MKVSQTARPLRPLCFDLENAPWAYWYPGEVTSRITAFGWKWRDEEEVHTLLLRHDGWWETDKKRKVAPEVVFRRFRDILQEAGIIYGHNIRRHDLPMFQAHLLRLGETPLSSLLTTDTLRDIPKRGGMSASLANLAAMYELGGEKFHLSQHDWETANELDSRGMELARQRVVSDVLLQEKLRDKLLDLGILKAPRTWRP